MAISRGQFTIFVNNDGTGIKKINTKLREFTLQTWKKYGEVGREENWSTGEPYDNSHINVGDTAYIVGIVTDVVGIGGLPVDAMLYGVVTQNVPNHVRMATSLLITGGEQGSQGANGIYREIIIEQYYLSKSVEEPTGGAWIDIVDNSTIPIEKSKYRFRRQKYIWSDHVAGTSEGESGYHIDYSVARLDETDERIVDWCSANDSLFIDGGHIYAHSISTEQLAANAIHSMNYNENQKYVIPLCYNDEIIYVSRYIKIGNEIYYAQDNNADSSVTYKHKITDSAKGPYEFRGGSIIVPDDGVDLFTILDENGNQVDVEKNIFSESGSFLDLENGNLYTPNLVSLSKKLFVKGDIVATSGNIGGCKIKDGILQVSAANITDKLNAGQIDATGITATGVNVSGTITATGGTIGGFHVTGNEGGVPAHFASGGQDGATEDHIIMFSGSGIETEFDGEVTEDDNKQPIAPQRKGFKDGEYIFWVGDLVMREILSYDENAPKDKKYIYNDSTRPFWIKNTGELSGSQASFEYISIEGRVKDSRDNVLKTEINAGTAYWGGLTIRERNNDGYYTDRADGIHIDSDGFFLLPRLKNKGTLATNVKGNIYLTGPGEKTYDAFQNSLLIETQVHFSGTGSAPTNDNLLKGILIGDWHIADQKANTYDYFPHVIPGIFSFETDFSSVGNRALSISNQVSWNAYDYQNKIISRDTLVWTQDTKNGKDGNNNLAGKIRDGTGFIITKNAIYNCIDGSPLKMIGYCNGFGHKFQKIYGVTVSNKNRGLAADGINNTSLFENCQSAYSYRIETSSKTVVIKTDGTDVKYTLEPPFVIIAFGRDNSGISGATATYGYITIYGR